MERTPRRADVPCALEPTQVGRVSPLRAAIANRPFRVVPDGAQGTARPTLRFMGSPQSQGTGVHWDHEPDQSERRSPDRRLSLANVNRPNWSSAFRFMESPQSRRMGARWGLEPGKRRTPNIEHRTSNVTTRCCAAAAFDIRRSAFDVRCFLFRFMERRVPVSKRKRHQPAYVSLTWSRRAAMNQTAKEGQ
jgi:hypothetical protein